MPQKCCTCQAQPCPYSGCLVPLLTPRLWILKSQSSDSCVNQSRMAVPSQRELMWDFMTVVCL